MSVNVAERVKRVTFVGPLGLLLHLALDALDMESSSAIADVLARRVKEVAYGQEQEGVLAEKYSFRLEGKIRVSFRQEEIERGEVERVGVVLGYVDREKEKTMWPHLAVYVVTEIQGGMNYHDLVVVDWENEPTQTSRNAIRNLRAAKVATILDMCGIGEELLAISPEYEHCSGLIQIQTPKYACVTLFLAIEGIGEMD